MPESRGKSGTRAADDTFEPVPLRTRTQRVRPEWIDFNGHMNVAYYLLAFDKASDEIFDGVLGIGEAMAREHRMGPMALQTQIHYLAELLEDEPFYCDFQVLDADLKRMHFFMTMFNAETGAIAATFESLTMNVDLEARRSAPYPDWAQARVARLAKAHEGLPRPPQAGTTIGIRRKG